MSTRRPLHHAVAPYRIGLIGGECSGKSTLAAALGTALPACVVPEALRDFVEHEGRAPHLSEQPKVFAKQVEREEEIAGTCHTKWLVADPAPLMIAAYSLAYFDDDHLLEAALSHASGYQAIVWCDPAIPWQSDGNQRDGADRRAQVDGLIAELVEPALQRLHIPVIRATGAPAQRVDTVTRWAWQHSSPSTAT